jgi:hypothetical protein
MNYISKHNKKLAEFRNIHEGRDSILFCTGPSLHKFNFAPFADDIIKVGVNRIYGLEQISDKLDYYFFGSHYHIDANHRQQIHKLREANKSAVFLASTFTAKFGDGRETGLGNISEKSANDIGAYAFECGAPNSGPGEGWIKEIDRHPFYGGSIAFPAVQFLLYTGVKRIFLVGCDLGNSSSHFHNSKNVTTVNDYASNFYLSAWKKLPDFLAENYPSVEIVTVNPAGLKGLFKDLHV